MTQLIPFETDHLVGYRVEGTVSEEDFDRVADAIEKRLERHETLQLYVEMASFEGMELEVLLKDFIFGIKHFDRFDRIAVVTDKGWIDTIVELESALVPGVDVKVFSFEEKERAMEWLMIPETA